MNEHRHHERCEHCHSVKLASAMFYIKRLYFCSVSCYRAYFKL